MANNIKNSTNLELPKKHFDLSLCKPVAKGAKKLIFYYPNDNDLLIKVLKPFKKSKEKNIIFDTISKLRQWYIVRLFYREIREYGKLKRSVNSGLCKHIPAFYGIADTNYGKGMIVEAIKEKDGGLCQTLKERLKSGNVQKDHILLLQEFFDNLTVSDIVAGDINSANLVLACHDGENKFVMIDGLGDKTLIPFRSWFPGNKRSFLEKKYIKLKARIEQALRLQEINPNDQERDNNS